MSAIWMRARAELRSNWRATVALVLMIGLAGGVVMSAAAGARRTDSSYGRFLAWAHAPDAGLTTGAAFGLTAVAPRAVNPPPEVASSALVDSFLFVSRRPP